MPTCHLLSLECWRTLLPSPLLLWILAVQKGTWMEHLGACEHRPVKCCPVGAASWLDNYCFPLSSEANCCHYQMPSNKSTIILVSLDQFSCGRKSTLRCFYFSEKPFCFVLGSPPRPAALLALGTPARIGCHLRGLNGPEESNQGHHFRKCPILNFAGTSHCLPPPHTHTHVITFFTFSIQYVTTHRFKWKLPKDAVIPLIQTPAKLAEPSSNGLFSAVCEGRLSWVQWCFTIREASLLLLQPLVLKLRTTEFAKVLRQLGACVWEMSTADPNFRLWRACCWLGAIFRGWADSAPPG